MSTSSGVFPMSKPYMDVSTLRNASSLSSRPREEVPHSSLLKEPVLVPYMSHLEVDSPPKLRDACMFYPTGEKNKNINRTIQNSIRSSKNFTVEKWHPAVPPKKHRPKKVDAVPHPRSQLYFGRKKLDSADNEIQSLIGRSRDIESRLTRTLLEMEAMSQDTSGD